MLTLFSYPGLYGLPDNNPYGLKVFTFLRLSNLTFLHEYLLDPSSAPRAQLPYLLDDGEVIGDSDAIISHLIRRYGLTIDAGLTPEQRDTRLLLGKLLDDLYWVMSYSRWKDERFWPSFRDALLTTHPDIEAMTLEGARQFNFKRYHYQGIGRYEPEEAYSRGIANLEVLANVLPETGFMFGAAPSSIDAGIYGFIASIFYFDIDTPLKAYLLSRNNLVAHCQAVRALMDP